MRQITNDAVNAFLAGRNFNRSNTSVEIQPKVIGNGEGKIAALKLHGNHIAHKDMTTGEIYVTAAGWKTTTTKERLNGIPGVTVHQKNFYWYLNGEAWEGGWKKINENSASYVTFKRTWWSFNSEWPGNLEPNAGEKYDIEFWDTREEARAHCQDMNSDPTNFPNPNTYSMKYEFDKLGEGEGDEN